MKLGKSKEQLLIALHFMPSCAMLVCLSLRLESSINCPVGLGFSRDIKETIEYANQRKQFGKPIADFGAIKHKIGGYAFFLVGKWPTYRLGPKALP